MPALRQQQTQIQNKIVMASNTPMTIPAIAPPDICELLFVKIVPLLLPGMAGVKLVVNVWETLCVMINPLIVVGRIATVPPPTTTTPPDEV
jgi:hypothetical protein